MLASSDLLYALNWSWAGLSFLSWTHTAILFIWPFCALVPGFSNGTFLHIVPLAYELFVLKLVSVSITGFPPFVDSKNMALEIKTKQQVIVFTWVILGIAIGINLAHGTYTLATINGSPDPLFWFLVAFSIVLFVLAILEAIMIYYLSKLKRHVDLLKKIK